MPSLPEDALPTLPEEIVELLALYSHTTPAQVDLLLTGKLDALSESVSGKRNLLLESLFSGSTLEDGAGLKVYIEEAFPPHLGEEIVHSMWSEIRRCVASGITPQEASDALDSYIACNELSLDKGEVLAALAALEALGEMGVPPTKYQLYSLLEYALLSGKYSPELYVMRSILRRAMVSPSFSLLPFLRCADYPLRSQFRGRLLSLLCSVAGDKVRVWVRVNAGKQVAEGRDIKEPSLYSAGWPPEGNTRSKEKLAPEVALRMKKEVLEIVLAELSEKMLSPPECSHRVALFLTECHEKGLIPDSSLRVVYDFLVQMSDIRTDFPELGPLFALFDGTV